MIQLRALPLFWHLLALPQEFPHLPRLKKIFNSSPLLLVSPNSNKISYIINSCNSSHIYQVFHYLPYLHSLHPYSQQVVCLEERRVSLIRAATSMISNFSFMHTCNSSSRWPWLRTKSFITISRELLNWKVRHNTVNISCKLARSK